MQVCRFIMIFNTLQISRNSIHSILQTPIISATYSNCMYFQEWNILLGVSDWFKPTNQNKTKNKKTKKPQTNKIKKNIKKTVKINSIHISNQVIHVLWQRILKKYALWKNSKCVRLNQRTLTFFFLRTLKNYFKVRKKCTSTLFLT